MLKVAILSVCGAAAFLAADVPCRAQSVLNLTGPNQASAPLASQSPPLYVKVRLQDSLKTSKLKPGDQIEGKLIQDVYSGDLQLFPADSVVRLTVDQLGRRRRVPNDHWPWVIKAFTPRHEKYPLFKSATVVNPGGHETPLQVSLVSINKEVEVSPKAKKNSNSHESQAPAAAKPRRELGPILTLEASEASDANSKPSSIPAEPVTLAAGTEAKVILLKDVSASKNRPGDSFQARFVEPVRLNSKIVIPEGAVLDGKVLKSQAPRMLSRSGSIYLTFTNLTLPGEPTSDIQASVSGAEISQRSHTVIDPEGRMHGDHPGKAWMLLNIGVTAGIAKEADDGIQLIIEAIVSTATDASTAGTGKIVSTCASGIFLLTRHGRDVVLPKYTQMKIMFDRPVSLPGAPLALAAKQNP